MPRRVMVAPVGFEYDRVLEALKFEPCNVWYILHNPAAGADPVGYISRRFSSKVIETLKSIPFIETNTIEVNQSDFLGLIKVFARVVRTECAKDPEAEFVFNVSSSTKLAGYAASHVAGFRPNQVKLLYMQPEREVVLASLVNAENDEINSIKSNYLEHGECQAPFKATYLPIVPFQDLTLTARVILRDLAVTKERSTVSQLVSIVTKKTTKPERNEIVKTGWTVKVLEHMHLVKVRKKKVAKAVSITPEGEAVAAALETISR